MENILFLILMQRGYFGTEVFRSLNSLKFYTMTVFMNFQLLKAQCVCPKGGEVSFYLQMCSPFIFLLF